jgi:anti-anti-sigma factor
VGTSVLNLEIDTQRLPDQIAIVHLKGEIDLHTCSLLRDTLRELIEQKFYQIVINLAEVPYLDSAALGVLVDAVRRAREHEGGAGGHPQPNSSGLKQFIGIQQKSLRSREGFLFVGSCFKADLSRLALFPFGVAPIDHFADAGNPRDQISRIVLQHLAQSGRQEKRFQSIQHPLLTCVIHNAGAAAFGPELHFQLRTHPCRCPVVVSHKPAAHLSILCFFAAITSILGRRAQKFREKLVLVNKVQPDLRGSPACRSASSRAGGSTTCPHFRVRLAVVDRRRSRTAGRVSGPKAQTVQKR